MFLRTVGQLHEDDKIVAIVEPGGIIVNLNNPIVVCYTTTSLGRVSREVYGWLREKGTPEEVHMVLMAPHEYQVITEA